MSTATYCPEDNKLRLYVGRVPRDEYEALRAEGWTSTPKQNCDFVATWTPERAARCLQYADLIEDEDGTPEDRAADRAERFGEYRDKRTAEAIGHADTYDAGPSAFGFQSQARAERAATRHDRHAGRACDAWSKAEYWQRRTAGVISHALYKSTPAVRMGRIKEIEADIRRCEKSREEYRQTYATVLQIAAMTDADKQTERAIYFFGGNGCNAYSYKHPRPDEVKNPYTKEKGTSLWSLLNLTRDDAGTSITGAEACALWLARHAEPAEEGPWLTHYRMRLAYENQMMEAAGGRAAFVEMEPGGWIGGRQIQKVNKSPATGRTVSVALMGTTTGFTRESGYKVQETRPCLVTVTVERLPADAYRPPTDEERAAFAAEKKARKAAAPKAPPCPLVNPTDEDAQRLQDVLNERAKDDHCSRHLRSYGKDYAEEFKPSTVCRVTQARYSEVSKGAYARAETRGLCADMKIEPRHAPMDPTKAKREREERGPALCQIRTAGADGSDYGARRVIILTDKPQKPIPAAVWRQGPAVQQEVLA